MCGICGLAGQADNKIISAMLERIAHRGPDDSGIYLTETRAQETIGLGHRRLSIIDLSPAGRQPMSSSDGRIWITYNGEVYNFPELRRTLESLGYGFRSDTDTEVVIAAYREWGERCVEKLNGMFAFAIWDAEEEKLFIARDRLGIKPVYYAQT